MKQQYFGDVNDYVKYGLLRHLIGRTALRAHVCWMLTDGDNRTDGGLIGYLDQPNRWRSGDPALFDHLRECVAGGRRDLRQIEADAWLPGATFFRERLVDDANARRAYFERLWTHAAGADLLFFDPDNGLETRTTPSGRRGSSRYLYQREAAEAYRCGHSLLIFQHFPRAPRRPFLRSVRDRVARHAPGAAVRSCATPRVAYLLAAQPPHAAPLVAALAEFASAWRTILRPRQSARSRRHVAAALGRGPSSVDRFARARTHGYHERDEPRGVRGRRLR